MRATQQHTQVGIIGAGPAGLMLAHLLQLAGIESVVLETRSREYCERRVRAGLLEPATVRVLCDTGLDRVARDGLSHDAIQLHFDGQRDRIPIRELAGESTTIYGQQEIVKDLLAARDGQGGQLHFNVANVRLAELTSTAPTVSYSSSAGPAKLVCDLIAGCDGFHGISRASIPAAAKREYQSERAANWFGILAQVPPTTAELVYALGPRGYAMHSMRGPNLTRVYLQFDPDTEQPSDWPLCRVWDELGERLATRTPWDQPAGPVVEAVTFAIRAFIVEPMRYGRLFLAGDSAHIVPPTGGKGLNAAIHDVMILADAIEHFYHHGSFDLLDSYSDAALSRNWRMLQFSVWMTDLLSIYRRGDQMELKLKYAELRQIASREPMARSFAKRYLGHL